MKKIYLFIFFVFATYFVEGAIITSKESGKWNETATWLGGILPTPTDDVIIRHIVTIPIAEYTPSYEHMGNIMIENYGKLIYDGQLKVSKSQSGEDVNFTIQLTSEYSSSSINIDNALIIGEGVTLMLFGKLNITNFSSTGSILTSIQNNGYIDISGQLTTIGNFDCYKNLITREGSILTIGIGREADFRVFTGADITFDGRNTDIDGGFILDGPGSSVCTNNTNENDYIRVNIGVDQEVDTLNGARLSQICQPSSGQYISIQSAGTTPVDIISFLINKNNLQWDVYEDRIDAYEVEHSTDINIWTKVGAMDSKGDGRNNYTLPIYKKGYYRLKVLSFEEAKYSHIVYSDGSDNIPYYPTQISSGNSVHFTGDKLIKNISLYSSAGILIQKIGSTESVIINQTPGLYILKMEGENTVTTGRLIVR